MEGGNGGGLGWSQGGGAACRIPHSPRPLRAVVVPSNPSAGSLANPARVWNRGRELAQQRDPVRTPLRFRLEGGELGRALGQLARAATAGLDKGVPSSLRSSSPGLPCLAPGDPQEP